MLFDADRKSLLILSSDKDGGGTIGFSTERSDLITAIESKEGNEDVGLIMGSDIEGISLPSTLGGKAILGLEVRVRV